MNQDCYALALRRLSVREYSTHELALYLEKKDFSSADVAEVLAELVRRKFIDDARYARIVARYQASRGKGPAYIRQKLRVKGVDLDLTEIREITVETTGQNDFERARKIILRKYPNYERDKAVAAKALQALVRRGFSFEVANQAIGRRGAIDLGED